MKNLLVFCITLLLFSNAVAQLVNCNEDSNGPVLIAGDVPDGFTQPEQVIIDDMNTMELISTANLSSSVYNNEKDYFPPIMHQGEIGLCCQASAVYYVLTYELNYYREENVTQSTKYHPSFIYNFLNEGVNEGSSLIYTFEALKEIGGMSFQSYLESTNSNSIHPVTQMNLDITEWISGFDYYEEALTNRVSSVEKIDLTSNNVTILKHWLTNHNDDSQNEGGICSIIFENMKGVDFSAGSGNHAGTVYINLNSSSTPEDDAHVMTIVGYDDYYQYGSGQTGALKIANSWGHETGGSGDLGYCYLPYSYINMPDLLTIDNNGKIWAFALHVDPDYTPDFILRQEIECNDRSSITQHSGGHFNFPEPYPYNGWRHEYETYTTYESSAIPILGTAYSNTPMQFSLDYQYFLDKEELDHNDIRSYFYGVKHDAPSSPEPTTLTYLSLVDNRCGNPLEIVEVTATNPVNMSDVSGYAYYWIGIDYPKLDENYSVNFTIDEQMYCHCVSEITDGATLEISGNTQLLFYDGEIIVNEGCTLDLNNASVIAKSGANKITVYGELIMDGNPMIQCDGGSFEIEYKTSFPLNTHYISGGRFYGQDLYTFLITGDGDNLIVGDENESCIFRKTKFNYSGDLTIQNLSNQSENIEITFSEGDLLIQNNTGLKNTFISASKPESDDNRITIQNNVFNNINETYNDYIIGIDDYTIYSIDENEINNGYCNAIGLYHAGNLVDEDINISNNVINNTSNPGTNRAVEVFFSKAEIFDNYIANNEYGIVAFGKSKSRIYGDMSAPTRYETQQFIENSIHCYFSYSSYPSKIRYNYFESQSTSDPYIKLVYYDIEDPGNPIPDPDQINSSTVYNIECNSWYSTFDPETQLIPLGSYDYDPYWYPGQYCTKDQTAAELVYDQAMLEIDSGNYVQADSMLKSVVSTYPTDPYSIQSLRELYALQGVLGNDYTGLRSYYLSVVSLNQDSLLCRSADWLGMHCLIKTGYNQEAIDWLDSTISVPKNTVDSIFAIINLGYIYTHFPDSSYKSGLITNYPGCIPTNYSNYRKDREHLVYELLKITGTDKPENPTLDAKVGSILSVSPNPSEGGSLKVNIETHTTGNSKLIIYNIQGMTVQEIDLGILEDTFVEKQIQLNHIPPGVYFISFIVNGVKADTKKVVVL